MTKTQALAIQTRQVESCVLQYGEYVRALVAKATTADVLSDGEHDVMVINQHIPRGGWLEHNIPHKRLREEASWAMFAGEAGPMVRAIDSLSEIGLAPIEQICDAVSCVTGEMLQTDVRHSRLVSDIREHMRDLMESRGQSDIYLASLQPRA